MLKQLTARLRELAGEPQCHEVPSSLLLEAADEIERLMSVVAAVNARCDHLGMQLGEVIRERDKLRRLKTPNVRHEREPTHDAAAALEIDRLRAALELAEPALELGCDALRSEAERYHAEMKGYRPHMHKQVDDLYKQADLAWQAVVAALGLNVALSRFTGKEKA